MVLLRAELASYVQCYKKVAHTVPPDKDIALNGEMAAWSKHSKPEHTPSKYVSQQ